MASHTMAVPKYAGRRSRSTNKETGPSISVSLPVWALPHGVRFVRFLEIERKSGPGLTRTLLDGR
jgi:hypothetical protein